MEFEPLASLFKDKHLPPDYSKYSPSHPSFRHPFAMPFQKRGPCSEFAGKLLGAAEAMQCFVCGIECLPDDILRSAVFEKYASAERARYQFLLATWDLEATRRKIRTLELIQYRFQSDHVSAESELRFWLGMYANRGLPDLKDDELRKGEEVGVTSEVADRDTTEFNAMVDHAKGRGLEIENFDDNPIDDNPHDDRPRNDYPDGDTNGEVGPGRGQVPMYSALACDCDYD